MLENLILLLYHVLVVFYLPAWFVGRLYKRHHMNAPSLGTRLLPFAMISLLAGFLTLICYGWVVVFADGVLHVPFFSPGASVITQGALLLPVFMIWVGITLWMWKAWVTRWELGFGVLWKGAIVMMVGQISVGFVAMLLSTFR